LTVLRYLLVVQTILETLMPQRTFLVTGASKGIGRAVSNHLAKAGHTVVGLARHADDRSFPGLLVTADLAHEEATEATLNQLFTRYSFDGVVNNVGHAHTDKIGQINLDQLTSSIAFNLRPAVQMVQALLPGMQANGWGRVVNISSLVTLGVPGRTAYSAAKSAITSFTRTWALELANAGITVNAVAPGPTETEAFRTNNPPGSENDQLYRSLVPMNRLGKPDEIGAAVAFLLSDDAGFITGQTLFVDGGASIGRSPV
jgi:3-oxoacyl-[acyl-carrier protein] reductase